jgi:glycosyltransferase involved in cell wall biosynthesis
MLTPKLEKIGPVAALEGYRPYFNRDNKSQRLEFSYREPQEKFVMGRVSRDDGNKFSADMWRIFDKVCSPRPTKTLILGYGDNARVKTGPPPAGLDHQTWPAGGLPVKEFYEQLHVLIHKTGGSRESFGRVVLEAYASGVPVIVENNYAFPDLVVQGVTGFLCRNSDEMSFAASILAFDEAKRKRMLEAGHEFLLNELADDERCWKPWKKILD